MKRKNPDPDSFAMLRQQAKKILNGQDIDLPELSVEDVEPLFRELQLHKIQLEAQSNQVSGLQEQLKQEQNKYSDLYDFAPVGYFTIGENGHILEVNLTGANMLAVAKSDLIDQPFFQFIARDSQDQFYVHRQQLLATKIRQRADLKLVRNDGKQFYAQLESIVIPNKKGDFDRFHTTMFDSTEQRQAQARVRHQEKMAAVGQLAIGIAHDFNNILQTIIGNTELLVNGQHDLPLAVRPILQNLNQQGQSATQLVRQLLEFSRRSMSDQHPVALVPFLEELVTLLEHTIPEHVQLILDYPPDQYWIKGDASQLEQAFLNLAINARDAMPDGGELKLSLSRQQRTGDESGTAVQIPSGDWIILRVSDTGTGISEPYLPHLFEPFFTTKTAGEGVGLGLAQVYGIVRRHGGYIDVTSTVGQGTTFSLYLPVLSMPTDIAPDPKPIELTQGQGETLLVVEDEPTVLETVRFSLIHLGYKVLTANSGREALELSSL
jgi:PAS domain S-box-containing protein